MANLIFLLREGTLLRRTVLERGRVRYLRANAFREGCESGSRENCGPTPKKGCPERDLMFFELGLLIWPMMRSTTHVLLAEHDWLTLDWGEEVCVLRA